MRSGLKVSVVIPTLNEAQGIKHTIEGVPDFVDEIIVVDGNSKDGTREIAAATSPRVKVILETRRGYGQAFQTGFAQAKGDVIVTIDGDGTYPVTEAGAMIDHLVKDQLEFISCSRLPLEDRASMRRRNWIGNVGMSVVASVLFFHWFQDVLSGMWVFRRDCLSRLNLQSTSWNFSEEIKIQAHRTLGSKFREMKIQYHERLGETKLSPFKVGFQNLVYLLAMRFCLVTLIRTRLARPEAHFHLRTK